MYMGNIAKGASEMTQEEKAEMERLRNALAVSIESAKELLPEIERLRERVWELEAIERVAAKRISNLGALRRRV